MSWMKRRCAGKQASKPSTCQPLSWPQKLGSRALRAALLRCKPLLSGCREILTTSLHLHTHASMSSSPAAVPLRRTPPRSKSPLSDNLEVVTAPALLEPEEAMVARKLSTIYERQTGSLMGRPSWRPSSAPARHGIAEGSEAGEATHAQLMEEGAVDSAAVQEGAMPSAAAAAAGLPGAAPAAEGGAAGAAAAAAGAAGEAGGAAVPAPSLMHDIVADWGVGMRDLGAVMRASVAVYQVRMAGVWQIVCVDSDCSGA